MGNILHGFRNIARLIFGKYKKQSFINSAIPEMAQNGAILVARRDWRRFSIGSTQLLDMHH